MKMVGETVKQAVRQVEDTAAGIARGAAASARREVSITGWANQVVSGLARKGAAADRPRGEGVYILPTKALRSSRRMVEQAIVAPDGYVRRSPVQEIAVSPELGRRRVIRVLQCAGGLAALVLVAYVLVRLNIIGI